MGRHETEAANVQEGRDALREGHETTGGSCVAGGGIRVAVIHAEAMPRKFRDSKGDGQEC